MLEITLACSRNLKTLLPCTPQNEYTNVCEIVHCFNCEQVRFQSTRMLETRQARRCRELEKLGRNIATMRNPL